MSNLGILGLVKAFRSLVPVCTHTLRSQLDFILILTNDLAKSKISDLYLAIVENDVLGLQIVVNYLLLIVVEVLETRQYL